MCCPDDPGFCAQVCPPHSPQIGISLQSAFAGAVSFGVVHNFTGADGASPLAGLVQDSNGTLYGMTNTGGSVAQGTIFKMAPHGSSFTVLHNFTGGATDGANPHGGLIRGADGALYGATTNGGASNLGAIFKIATDGSGLTVLYSFAGGSTDGASPYGGLIQGPDGTVYGTTRVGGSDNLGTVFRIAPDGSGFTILHNFTGGVIDGATPNSSLIQGPDGTLYGTTVIGGSEGNSGTIFKIAPDGSGFTVLRSFTGGSTDGANPFGSLIVGRDGKLYGTTRLGGSANLGTVFQIAPDGSGFTILHNFIGNPTDGAHPYAGLIQASDGTLYGTTINGGTNRVVGTIFQLAPDGSTYSVRHIFDVNAADGALPFAGLLQAPDGTLYGTTSLGGANSNGIVFQLGLEKPSGDFFGDGKADYAVFRPSGGTWYVLDSNGAGNTLVQQWGTSGDVPLRGDFDGDGKSDFAVWRPSMGEWFVIPSGNPGSPIMQQWGTSGDIPVPGDYDGDGKTDYAVWRPSAGEWFIIPSSNPGSPTVQQWGTTGDIPVPVDYDGDGKTDIAVWRPSNGTWYIIPSATPTNFTVTQWGTNDDIPIQKPIGQ